MCLAVAFGWVAVLGDPRYMSGGLPFLPREYDVSLGRAAFGLAALFFLWLGISALKGAKRQPERGVVESDP